MLNELSIPVWVMEPLRGGKLAHLAPQYEAELKAMRPDEEIAAWAFRFLQSTPGVTMILSGMSNQEQLEKNLATFAEDRKLNETEKQTLLGIAEKMLSVGTVPCTACHYCVSHCPMSLDIPHLPKKLHCFCVDSFAAQKCGNRFDEIRFAEGQLPFF